MNGNLQLMTSTPIARMDSPTPRRDAAATAAPDAPPASSSESGFEAIFSAYPRMLSPEAEADLTSVFEEEVTLSEDIALSEDLAESEDIIISADPADTDTEPEAEADDHAPEIEECAQDNPNPKNQTPRFDALSIPPGAPAIAQVHDDAAPIVDLTRAPQRPDSQFARQRPLPVTRDPQQNPRNLQTFNLPQDPAPAQQGNIQNMPPLDTAQRAWMPAAPSRETQKNRPAEVPLPIAHDQVARPHSTATAPQTVLVTPSNPHTAQLEKTLMPERDLRAGPHIDPVESVDHRSHHANMPLHSIQMTTQTSRNEPTATSVIHQLTAAVITKPSGETEIALHPEELGRLHLKMHSTEAGALTIIISAERTDTAELLRRNLSTLQSELATLGMGDANISFAEHSGQNERTEHDQSASFGAEGRSAKGDPAAKDSPILARLGPTDSLDLRL